MIPTGKVTTIQIVDTYLIANLLLNDPTTIQFQSYIVDLFVISSANVTLDGTLSSLGLIVDAPSTIFDESLLFDNLTAGIKWPPRGNNNTGIVLDLKICGTEPVSCKLETEFCTLESDHYNPWYGCNKGNNLIFNHSRVFTFFDGNEAIETINVGSKDQHLEINHTGTVEVPRTSCTLMQFLDADGAGNSLITRSGLWTISVLLTFILVLQ